MSDSESKTAPAPSPTPTGTTTDATGSKRRWTPDELRILKFVAHQRGWDYAEKNAYLILAQAEMIGEL